MSFSRKWLTALGVEPDKVDEIISEHIAVVDGLKEERDVYKKEAEKVVGLEAELETVKADAAKVPALQKELDDLKASSSKDYETLKTEYDNYKAEQASKAEANAKAEAYKTLLKDAGVSDKRFDSILKVTDLSNIELDDNGQIKDADKLSESIKSDWSDFIVTEEKIGANTITPPEDNGGKMTKEEILKIKNTTERQKAISENHELFGY